MSKNNQKSEEKTDIRRQAEEMLKGKSTDLEMLSVDDAQSLVHELQVHQIELEMHNEELRRAQKELEAAHTRYSDLYDFAPIGYFTLDKNGMILEANLTGAKKLGIVRSDLIKTLFSLYIAPDYKDVFYLHMRQVFNTEKQMTCELVLADTKGNIFCVLLESMPVQDSDGNVLWRTMMSDITQLKRAEEKLREASLYTRSLIEVSLDPLITINEDGKITDVNHATESVTGVSREQLIGSDFSDYFTEPEKAREVYQKVFENGFVKDYPLSIRHVSGSITDVMYNASVYKDAAGNVAGVFSAARDITSLKNIENSLRKSKTFIETVLNSINDAISVIDVNDFRIIAVSTSFLKMYGLNREEIMGKTCYEITHKCAQPCASQDEICPLLGTLETGKYSTAEHVHSTMNGEKSYVEVATSLVKDEN